MVDPTSHSLPTCLIISAKQVLPQKVRETLGKGSVADRAAGEVEAHPSTATRDRARQSPQWGFSSHEVYLSEGSVDREET